MDREEYLKIINDIAEDIDNKETRKQLRETIVWLSKELYSAYSETTLLKDKVLRMVLEILVPDTLESVATKPKKEKKKS